MLQISYPNLVKAALRDETAVPEILQNILRGFKISITAVFNLGGRIPVFFQIMLNPAGRITPFTGSGQHIPFGCFHQGAVACQGGKAVVCPKPVDSLQELLQLPKLIRAQRLGDILLVCRFSHIGLPIEPVAVVIAAYADVGVITRL